MKRIVGVVVCLTLLVVCLTSLLVNELSGDLINLDQNQPIDLNPQVETDPNQHIPAADPNVLVADPNMSAATDPNSSAISIDQAENQAELGDTPTLDIDVEIQSPPMGIPPGSPYYLDQNNSSKSIETAKESVESTNYSFLDENGCFISAIFTPSSILSF